MNNKNPVGTNGFAFVEFTSLHPAALKEDFIKLGFLEVAKHKHYNIYLFRQGEINFLINENAQSHAVQFAALHGASASAMGWRVKNAAEAHAYALAKGAVDCDSLNCLELPAIIGVGGSLLYFMDDAKIDAYFDEHFEFYSNVVHKPEGAGLNAIDHLTHNVKWGNMNALASFYENIFNFHQVKYFHIRGQKTSLESRAMTSPCGKIRIPINESSDEKSQIVEFLNDFRGDGIQHIALSTKNIYHTIAEERKNGIKFLDTPDAYFDMINKRLPWHQEDINKLRELKILIDGEKTPKSGLLLQIFTENMLGPVFFEIIQRKGNEGFGEGNFQALFEAIERDQILRGKL